MTRRIAKDATSWSPQQQEVLSWFEGTHPQSHRHLVIRARAGTGKTHTILRGAYLSNARSVRMMAFGARIAAELQDKLAKKRYGGSGRVKAMTLHSCGYHYFYDYDAANVVINTPRGPAPIRQVEVDRQRDSKFLQEYQNEFGVPVNKPPYRALLLRLIELTKQVCPFAGIDPANYWADLIALGMLQEKFRCRPAPTLETNGFTAQIAAEIALWAVNRSVQVHTKSCTNDDQIFLPLRRNWVTPTHDLVIVDEAQDMTTAQLELAIRITTPDGRIVVVGDDRQAIYGFRGADTGALDRLKYRLNALELPLTTTYRCDKNIVQEVACWVPDLVAAPTAGQGVVYDDVPWESLILNAQEGDFVLSRTNAPLIDVVFAVIKNGKKARILGRDGLKEQLTNIINNLNFYTIRALREKLSDKLNGELERLRQSNADESDMKRVIDQYDFLLALAQECQTVPEMLLTINELIIGSQDGLDPSQYISCSSIHQAKGLEADRVFVLEDTLFMGRGDPLEEENIAYVAYTRARKALWKCRQKEKEKERSHPTFTS